ncbi:MAG: hypothetical protein IJ272_09830 [Clostridia bacterium]|nr:hypothetical protein [Clostridia bacterium]
MANIAISEKLLSKMAEDDYAEWHSIMICGNLSRDLCCHLNSNDKNFSVSELMLVSHLLHLRVHTDQIIRITTPSFSDAQVNRLLMYANKLKISEVEIFSKSELSIQQMDYCYILFSMGISAKDIDLFCTFTEQEMKEVCGFY